MHASPVPALDIVRLLFWGTILTVSALCVTDQTLRSIIKGRWKIALCALVLTLIWRIPVDGHFYHGLEYEDSYVYTVAARQVLENTPGNEAPIGFPYSISTCAAGSLQKCRDWKTYPEHLIGTAYVISAYARIVGYTPDVGSWVAVFAACVSCCLIVLATSLLRQDAAAAASAALIFAMTPIFAVQGLETSAEPVSNAAISVVVFLLVFVMRRFSAFAAGRAALVFLALTLSIGFAMTVKRENALLLIAVPVLLLTVGPRDFSAGLGRKAFIVAVFSIAIVGGLFAWHLNVAHTGEGEVSLVTQFRPTVAIMARIVLAFVRSFLVPAWYFCGFVFVGWGMITSRRDRPSLAVTMVFLGFLILYALHIRGYYELRSGDSDPRSALRFEMSLMSLWSILGGVGVAAAYTRVRSMRMGRRTRMATIAGGGALVGLFALSYGVTRSLRTDGVEDEAIVRIAPATTAIHLASLQSEVPNYIITFEPLVVQMYADPSTNVLDISIVHREECRRLGLLGTARGILIDEDFRHSAADAARYSEQLLFLSSLRKTTVYRGTGFTIASISFPRERADAATDQKY